MKKIGLITIYHVPNYGSVLQTFATQEVLKKLGYECVVLKYKYPNKWHFEQGRQPLSIKSRIALMLGIKPTHRKAKKLESFRNKYFNFSKSYSSLDELKSENWNDYYAVAVGSDQVWNARYTFADSAFMLSFVPDKTRCISIASSFAMKSLPVNIRDKYHKYLERFNAISVRENNGINIITNELGLNKSPEIILDPTLLLSKEDWLNLVPRSKFIKKKKYILLYMLTYAFEPRPYIFEVLKYMQNKYNYEIIALEGYTPPSQAKGIVMKDKTDADISEFIDLFANADMVITSSFHGTAFAVNFGIPLVSIIPNDKGDDRQSSLLKQLGLINCIVPIEKDIEDINMIYDNTISDNILFKVRRVCLNWINENI